MHQSTSPTGVLLTQLKALSLILMVVLAVKHQSLGYYLQQQYQLPLLSGSETPQPSAALIAQLQALGQNLEARLAAASRVLVLGDTPAPQPSAKPAPSVEPPAPGLAGPDSCHQPPAPSPAPEPSALGQIALQANDRVLLAGDSMMQGVAPHLAASLRRQFGANSLDLSRHSTGLAYQSLFNWPKTIHDQLASGQFTALVILIGANDTGDLFTKNRALPFGSPQWQAFYAERVQAILQSAETFGVKVLWLGAPPMGREGLAERIPALNAVYQAETAKKAALARYLATAPLLSPDGQAFAKFLELPERGKVMVRTNDGVHFTATGQRLLAQLTLEQFTASPSEVTAQWQNTY
jgi:uncharacterized protein